MFLEPGDEAYLSHHHAWILSRRGECLWRSPAFLALPHVAPIQRIIGTAWHEFVHHEDLPDLLRWIATEPQSEDEVFRFCTMRPGNGEMHVAAWHKSPYGENWLLFSKSLGPCEENCQHRDDCTVRQSHIAKSQEPRAKSQEPRAKSQEPRAKSQEPKKAE